MKKIVSIIFLVLASLTGHAQVRQEVLLTKNWRFIRQDVPGAEAKTFDDAAWESVIVPHDWAIKGPFDKDIDKQVVAIVQNGERIPSEKTGRTGSLPHIGVGWYRTQFSVPDAPDKTVTLLFDGAMSDAHVYVNGRKAIHWPNGYNAFYVDVTPYLNAGSPNTLAVRLENLPESSRWYPGTGLYRPVRLLITHQTAISPWGVRITTPQIASAVAQVRIESELAHAVGKPLRVTTAITDASGREVASAVQSVTLLTNRFSQDLYVPQPMLWSPESPALYWATIRLFDGEQLRDEYRVRFGIRDVKMTAEGFVLNGKPRKFKGVCLHHDLGPLGAATNRAAMRRQLVLMKEMGADAIRTSHNMPAPEQMDLCDELGLMVMAESFDEWLSPKMKNGYHRYFTEWADRDLTNLIRCHRNHPSIVMWSIGNEVPEQGDKHGSRLVRYLQDICHREDPTRPVTCGMDQIASAARNNFAAVLDVPGINYNVTRYEQARDVVPQPFILSTETASTVSSRGVYKLPVREVKDKVHPDRQSSSYDVEACGWSNPPEYDWVLQDDKPWTIGEFVWTGIDYLGEPTPYNDVWPARSSYFGMCDLAGLPKDRYYLYRSRWNTKQHTLHLLPHWNWEGREGDTIPVYCYTDYPSAELFVNGRSQGKRTKNPSSLLDRYRLRWNDVVYQPGRIEVVAYDAAGKEAERTQLRTAGAPYGLRLTPDRTTLKADKDDMVFVTVDVVDKQGNLCPNATNALAFSVSGAGTYQAACNGDATSLEPFHLPRMKAFSGKLVVLVRATDQPGTAKLTVTGAGLKTASVDLISRP